MIVRVKSQRVRQRLEFFERLRENGDTSTRELLEIANNASDALALLIAKLLAQTGDVSLDLDVRVE